MKWFQKSTKEDGTEESIEVKPEQLKKDLGIDTLKTDVDKSMDDKLKPVLEFINQQKTDREAALAAAKNKKNREDAEEMEVKPEDWITDPEGATRKTMQPIKDRNDVLTAIVVRKEVLGDMEYYSDPKFKAEVDKLIDAQPMASRGNPQVVMNAYKSVHYDMRKEIEEGKIKSKTAMTTFSGNGTGNHKGNESDDKDPELTGEEKAYAAKFGISDAEWKKSKRELEYV